MKLAVEDQQEGDEFIHRKLKRALCGARDAAQSWQRICSNTVRVLGFRVGKVWPCHFSHETRQVCRLVHRDDGFVLAGHKKYLEAIVEYMTGKFKIRTAFTGPKKDEVFGVLKRSIKWTRGGVIYESDHRHAIRLIEGLGLTKKQTAATPAIRHSRKPRKKEEENDDTAERTRRGPRKGPGVGLPQATRRSTASAARRPVFSRGPPLWPVPGEPGLPTWVGCGAGPRM